MSHSIRDCSIGVLNAACTLLDPADIPPVRVVPGPRFAHDCTMLYVQPSTIIQERSALGKAADDFAPLRPIAAQVTIPVRTIIVHYNEVCLPLPDVNGKLDEVAYNAAACAYLDHAEAIYQGVLAAVRQGTLFEPGIFGTCVPPDVPDPCAGIEVGTLTYDGPNGDSAFCYFPVVFQDVSASPLTS